MLEIYMSFGNIEIRIMFLPSSEEPLLDLFKKELLCMPVRGGLVGKHHFPVKTCPALNGPHRPAEFSALLSPARGKAGS